MKYSNQIKPISETTFRILIALSAIHFLNDALQALLSSSYPILKEDLQISFAQIGLITLVYHFFIVEKKLLLQWHSLILI